MSFIKPVCCAIILVCICSCSLTPPLRPTVDVRLLEIKKVRTSEISQYFFVKIELINESEQEVLFKNINLDLELEGYRLFRGLQKSDIVLKSRGSAIVEFNNGVRLEDSVRLFNELAARSMQQPHYLMRIKLTPASWWWPFSWSLEQTGQISLQH